MQYVAQQASQALYHIPAWRNMSYNAALWLTDVFLSFFRQQSI